MTHFQRVNNKKITSIIVSELDKDGEVSLLIGSNIITYPLNKLLGEENVMDIPIDSKNLNLSLYRNSKSFATSKITLPTSSPQTWITFTSKDKKKNSNIIMTMINCVKIKFNIKLGNTNNSFQTKSTTSDTMKERHLSSNIVTNLNRFSADTYPGLKNKVNKPKAKLNKTAVNYRTEIQNKTNELNTGIDMKYQNYKSKSKAKTSKNSIAGNILYEIPHHLSSSYFNDLSFNKENFSNNFSNSNHTNSSNKREALPVKAFGSKQSKKSDGISIENNSSINTTTKFFPSSHCQENQKEPFSPPTTSRFVDENSPKKKEENINVFSDNESTDEKDDFIDLKNDFYIFYTDDYINNISGELVKLEFELCIDKILELITSYYKRVKILEKKKKYYTKIFNRYSKKILKLKKEYFDLQIEKENCQIQEFSSINIAKPISHKEENLNIKKLEVNLFKNIISVGEYEKQNKKNKLKELMKDIYNKNSLAYCSLTIPQKEYIFSLMEKKEDKKQTTNGIKEKKRKSHEQIKSLNKGKKVTKTLFKKVKNVNN